MNEVTALGVIMLSTRVTNFLTKPPVGIIGNFPLRKQRDSRITFALAIVANSLPEPESKILRQHTLEIQNMGKSSWAHP